MKVSTYASAIRRPRVSAKVRRAVADLSLNLAIEKRDGVVPHGAKTWGIVVVARIVLEVYACFDVIRIVGIAAAAGHSVHAIHGPDGIDCSA